MQSVAAVTRSFVHARRVARAIVDRIWCLLGLASLVAAGAAVGCKAPGDGAPASNETASASSEVTVQATVRSVDKDTRVVTLERSDGSPITVVAGDDVRNLDQVEAGDTVKVHYLEAVVAKLKKPGEAVSPPEEVAAVGRAAPGEKPGGVAGRQVSGTVKIESVDLDTNIVVFTPPEGGLRALAVKRPEFREYLKTLKPGDQVEITYTEAIAVSVEERPAE